MSLDLYETGGLRFWTEREILERDSAVSVISNSILTELKNINGAWRTERVEGPIITVTDRLNPQYTGEDIWLLNAPVGENNAALRPETTPSSYAFANHLLSSHKKVRLPLCVWQVGKSFRRETADGASPSKLRFNEFYQMEFQCIYSLDTKMDYYQRMLPLLEREIGLFTGHETRVVESDRLPSYSEKTMDVEVYRIAQDRWTEMCSVSLRTDFPDAKVFEIAIGLDRLIEVRNDR